MDLKGRLAAALLLSVYPFLLLIRIIYGTMIFCSFNLANASAKYPGISPSTAALFAPSFFAAQGMRISWNSRRTSLRGSNALLLAGLLPLVQGAQHANCHHAGNRVHHVRVKFDTRLTNCLATQASAAL